MDFLGKERRAWRPSDSLAAVTPDPERSYRIVEVASVLAGTRCRAAGIEPGALVRVRISTPETLVIELVEAGGRIETLEISYAWHVRVEPAIPHPVPGTPWRRGQPTGVSREVGRRTPRPGRPAEPTWARS